MELEKAREIQIRRHVGKVMVIITPKGVSRKSGKPMSWVLVFNYLQQNFDSVVRIRYG